MKALSFEGSGFEYFKIWIVNIVLTIITFGIYYPWAKVRNNRYFYANSILEEKNFEYHATGKQLFIGYLIAITLFITYQIVAQFLPLVSLGLALLLAVAIPWLIWRSMKFNMNVTSFNNVKFKFIGQLGESYVIFLVYPILFFISIGAVFTAIAYLRSGWVMAIGMIFFLVLQLFFVAYLSVKKNSYIINSSLYGQGKFNTNLEMKNFVKIIIKSFFINLLLLVVAGIVLISIAYVSVDSIGILEKIRLYNDNPEVMASILHMIAPLLFVMYILIIIAGFITMAYYTVRTREYIFDNTMLDEKIEFSSTLKFVKLAFIILTNLLVILFTLGLAIPWAKVRLTRYMLENTYLSSNKDLTVYINEKQNKESAIGEEIGDVFDVDVGFAI